MGRSRPLLQSSQGASPNKELSGQSRDKEPCTPGRKREEESGEAGSLRGRKAEEPWELQVSKHSPLQPRFRCRPVSSPDIPPAPARHSVQGKSPRKAQVREERRAWVLEPCQGSLRDEEREAIGKDVHGDAKKHTSVEAENQGHLMAAMPHWRGAPG